MSLQWSSRLAIGVASLDRDHRQIIALLNLTLDALQLRDAGIARELAVELVLKVREHFQAEEALVAASGYPAIEGYRRSNAAALADLEAVERGILVDPGAPSLVGEVERLADIFARRLDEDLALKPYLGGG